MKATRTAYRLVALSLAVPLVGATAPAAYATNGTVKSGYTAVAHPQGDPATNPDYLVVALCTAQATPAQEVPADVALATTVSCHMLGSTGVTQLAPGNATATTLVATGHPPMFLCISSTATFLHDTGTGVPSTYDVTDPEHCDGIGP